VVDIGYNYVAGDALGNPLETITNTIPDYLMDAVGDGLPNAWEYYWFGNYNQNGSEEDSQGNMLLYDYENGLDPDVIQFTIEAPNDHVNTTTASFQLNILGGWPSYYALFTDSDDTTNWLPFTGTNFTITLGPADSMYNIVVGLKGFAQQATETWQSYAFYLDRVAPVVTITNPIIVHGVATVGKPYLQLQGFATEPLARLCYNLTNAAGIINGADVYVTDQALDTNACDFSTNFFQAYDVPLTNGVNYVSLVVTDRAGNTTVTNFEVVLDYSTVTAKPVVNLTWPQAGWALSGSSCTIRGTMEDETGSISAVEARGHRRRREGKAPMIYQILGPTLERLSMVKRSHFGRSASRAPPTGPRASSILAVPGRPARTSAI
jgi:hypothetical protein